MTTARTIKYRRPWLAAYQKEALFGPERYAVIEGSTKCGKAQPLDALIYTPAGPVRMGDIAMGTVVCTPDGGASPVIGIYPQGVVDIYRLTFSDGSIAECTHDHLWEVDAGRSNYKGGFSHRLKAGEVTKRRKDLQSWPRVMPLSEIMEYSERRLKRVKVRLCGVAEFAERPVPIDPYALGVLIAEGGLTDHTVRVSTRDQHVLDRVKAALGVGGYEFQFDGRCSYRITAGSACAAKARGTDACLSHRLRGLDLKGKFAHEKHIPAAYRYNSEAVRWAIVQGIMDGDGFVDHSGQPHLEQTSAELARDFIEIAESLGASCILNVKEKSFAYKDGEAKQGRPVYRVLIRHTEPSRFFSLPRKRDACRPRTKSLTRQIAKIEKVDQRHAQCIQLDDKRGLYLTDRFVVTHNTAPCLVWLAEQAMAGKAGQNFWWVAPVYPQAEIAFRRMKRGLPAPLYKSNSTDKWVELKNGARMWFKSAEKPDNLYGEDVYGAVIDEASRCREESWHAVRSTLTATRGKLRIIGNVKGRKNWAYKLARRAEAGEPGMIYRKVTALDAVAAGLLPQDEIDQARRDLPEQVFRELYMAEPSDDGGNPFGISSIQKCIRPLSCKPPTAWGWDLAKSVDWTVGIALDENKAACRFERFQKPWTETIATIKRESGRVGALVDAQGVGDPIVETLQREGTGMFGGFKFSAQSKQQLMEGLAVAIQRQEVSFPDGPIVSELEAFEYEYTRTGVRYTGPEGMHDDCVMALGLAVKAASTSYKLEIRELRI